MSLRIVKRSHAPRSDRPLLRALVVWLIIGTQTWALSLFQIGNSFTDDTRFDGTVTMLEERLGEEVTLGYHWRGNTTLDTLWNDPTASGTRITEFGDHTVALPGNHWDYLTLQTFPSLSRPTLGEEVARIQDFASAADLGNGGTTQVIIYGPWAGLSETAWHEWDDPIVDDPDTWANYSADYRNTLYDHVAALFPGRTRLADAGKVFREIRGRIDAGDAPIEAIDELYRDSVHLSYDIGRFIASTVIQTTILGRSQVGQPVPRDLFPWIEERFSDHTAEWVQLVVWEVLLEDERSHVVQPAPGDYDGNGEFTFSDWKVWRRDHGSTTRLIADGNGDGVVDAADYNIWRDQYTGAIPPVGGDYNADGQVTSLDYEQWVLDFGTDAFRSDGNGDGVVDAADYTVWRDHYFGEPGNATSVPEPTSLVVAVLAAFVASGVRRGTNSHRLMGR